MPWELIKDASGTFASQSVIHWLPGNPKLVETSLTGGVRAMARLRSQTAAIYVNAVYKDHVMKLNCAIRYMKKQSLFLKKKPSFLY